MPENRQSQTNAGSNPPSETARVWRLKVRDNQEGDEAPSGPIPGRPGELDCIYYLRTGLCGYGNNCRYNHPSYGFQGQTRADLPQRAGQPNCGYFLKTGTCKYGPTCKYHHPGDRLGAEPISLNIVGLPMRRKTMFLLHANWIMQVSSSPSLITWNHLTWGWTFCNWSYRVFNCPLLWSILCSGLSTLTLPRAPHISGSRVQGPHAYIPVIYSPSQGILPTHGWNTYLGSMSPISSSAAGNLGPSLVYDSRNQGESGSTSSGQEHLLSTPVQCFPERPDQPECRYFMSTGRCKYGSDCNYRHPKERIATANTMGPFGLPLRPGQPVCSYYNLYGLCKHGPTCKYDHPRAGYSYNYGVNLPSLSLLEPSVFSHPRNSPAAHAPKHPPLNLPNIQKRLWKA